jgi:hypothetical protein
VTRNNAFRCNHTETTVAQQLVLVVAPRGSNDAVLGSRHVSPRHQQKLGEGASRSSVAAAWSQAASTAKETRHDDAVT